MDMPALISINPVIVTRITLFSIFFRCFSYFIVSEYYILDLSDFPCAILICYRYAS